MNKKIVVFCLAAACAFSITACGKSAKQLNNEGINLYNANKYNEAEDVFSEAVALDTENAEYYVNLGMTQLELKEYAKAQSSFALAMSYDNTDRRAYHGLALVYYFEGEYEKAEDAFETLITKSGENFDSITLEALQYYASLEVYFENYAIALDSYDILIKKKYEVAKQYYLKGNIYTSEGMENEAVDAYEQALKEYGKDYEVYYNIYTSFVKAGYKERGESYLKRGLALNASDMLLKGKTYYILGDYQNAKTCLSKAIDNGQKEAQYYLAMTYEELGDYEEAEPLYQSYIDKYPEDSCAFNQYGMYWFKKQEYEKALELFKRGLSVANPEAEQELLFNEACCYEYLEQYEIAFSLFDSYVQQYPEDAAAKHERDFLSTR